MQAHPCGKHRHQRLCNGSSARPCVRQAAACGSSGPTARTRVRQTTAADRQVRLPDRSRPAPGFAARRRASPPRSSGRDAAGPRSGFSRRRRSRSFHRQRPDARLCRGARSRRRSRGRPALPKTCLTSLPDMPEARCRYCAARLRPVPGEPVIMTGRAIGASLSSSSRTGARIEAVELGHAAFGGAAPQPS